MLLIFVLFALFQIGFNLKPKPWEPVEKAVDSWIKKHKSFLAETELKKTNVKIVFYGDSITEGWKGNGRNVWKKYYANLSAVNYGIGGDRTEHLVYRINSGEVRGLTPKVVVLKIGTNNLHRHTSQEISQGIKTIIDNLLPKTKVLLLAILPRNTYNSKVEEINKLISGFNNNNTVKFLNMTAQFQDSPTKLKTNLYNKDGLHLAEPGYETWAKTMDPLLKQMLE